MRIELERTGGLIGRTMRWTLDTEQLPPDEAREIDTLLTDAQSWGGPPATGADRFSYRLRVFADTGPVEVIFGELAPDAAQPLLARLRQSDPSYD